MKTQMTDFEVWHPAQSPLAIEYTKAVLDEVRDQGVAGYRRLSRGGVEVGGILFGIREAEKVRILATQPIACEYKSGPSFVLSDKDKSRLRDQLTQAASSENLKDFKVVGWYVSHPRGSVALSDRDLDVFNEFFPDVWNVTLVMKPDAKGVRAGFFLREPHGALNFAHSHLEFDLGLPKASEGASAVRQIAEQVGASLAAQRDSQDEGLDRRRGGGRRDIAEMLHPAPHSNGFQDVTSAFIPQGASAYASASEPAPPPHQSPPPPSAAWSTAVARPRPSTLAHRPLQYQRRLQWRWLVMWAVVVGCSVAAAFAYREFAIPTPLGLRVVEKDGDLMIYWDASSRSIEWAKTGKLEVRGSGAAKTEIDLRPQELSKGAFPFGASGGDVSIRMEVTGKMGFHADESTRYVARVTPTEADKPVEIRDRRLLQMEVLRLRDELEKSQQRVKELETLLYNR